MWFYDFEVFMYDWLVVFNDGKGREILIQNDAEELKEFMNRNKDDLFIGFNNKGYDNYILKVILLGGNPYRASQIIIEEENILKLFRMYDLNSINFNSYDVMLDTLMGSLKEHEAWFGMDIEESSVPFDIPRKLTKEELELTIKYCKHDVKATITLFDKIKDKVKIRMSNLIYFGLGKDNMIKTNGKLAEVILGVESRGNFNDEFEPYEKPSSLRLKDNIDLLDFFSEIDYTRKELRDIAGVPHVIGYGGIHGARKNFKYEGEMWLLDVNSYYPSLMIVYDFLSRAVKGDNREKFKLMYDLKKNAKDKTVATANKLVLNTTYGCMKDRYNRLYDPRNANNVCITGQLLLIDLIEKVEPYATLVQSNTDGILVIPHNKVKVRECVNEWQNRTGMDMSIDVYTKIFQKDVNNYITVDKDGNVKAIGSYVRQAELTNYRDLKCNLQIIDDAVVNYLVNGTPIHETINNCDDMVKFQLVTKTGRSYNRTVWIVNDKERTVNKVNRIYAVKDTRCGHVIKVDDIKFRRAKVQNCPDHAYVDNEMTLTKDKLDIQWYIDLAEKRVKDYI